MLRSEDRALGGPTSKEVELDREMEREELVCPSPGPWQSGVKSLQLGDGEGMGTINLRRWLKCSKQQWRVAGEVRKWAVSRQEVLKMERGHPLGAGAGSTQEAL